MAINSPSDNLQLAEVLRAANDLVAGKLIEDWALGGALAAIYYVEPFTTYDADIFFIPKDKGMTAGIPAIYAHLQAQVLAGRARTSAGARFPRAISRRPRIDRRSRSRGGAD